MGDSAPTAPIYVQRLEHGRFLSPERADDPDPLDATLTRGELDAVAEEANIAAQSGGPPWGWYVSADGRLSHQPPAKGTSIYLGFAEYHRLRATREIVAVFRPAPAPAQS